MVSSKKKCGYTHHQGKNPLPLSSFGKNKRMPDGLHYWCISCCKRWRKSQYSTNPSYKRNAKKRASDWQKENVELVNATSQRYRDRNKEKRKEITKRWRDKNKVLTCFLANKRRAQKLKAMPRWFEKQEVKALYEKAARLTVETGVPHHVDHIVPLQSEVVCRLHCLANLQILTATDNFAKSNRLAD